MRSTAPWFFFFSSRRRHTRWTGDWSSDVCSSDLGPAAGERGRAGYSALASVTLKLDPDLPDAGHHLDPQLLRGLVVPAALVHQLLDDLFQAVLTQARAALVEVLADLGAARRVQLLVQVPVELRKHLGTGRFVRFAAAHAVSSPGPLSAREGCWSASGATLARPLSAA